MQGPQAGLEQVRTGCASAVPQVFLGGLGMVWTAYWGNAHLWYPVVLSAAFAAFVLDTVTGYALARCQGRQDKTQLGRWKTKFVLYSASILSAGLIGLLADAAAGGDQFKFSYALPTGICLMVGATELLSTLQNIATADDGTFAGPLRWLQAAAMKLMPPPQATPGDADA